jgi:hypothetical protein
VAIVYLLAALAGLRRRWRLTFVAMAAVIAVALPAFVVVRVGLGAGVRRAQDPWYVATLRSHEAPGPGAWAERPGYKPTPVIEGWTSSWRRDPPRAIAARPPSPGAFALGKLMRGLGLRDPRVLSTMAALLATLLAAALVRPESRPLVASVLLLAPAGALGVVLGAGDAVPLLFVLAAWLAARRSSWTAGALLGAGGAAAPQALLLRPATADWGPGRWAIAVAVGFVAVSLPLAVPFFGEFLRWASDVPTLHPGIGLSNFLYYRPVEPTALMAAWRIATPIALLALAFALGRSPCAGSQPLAAAGALWACAIFLLPSVPAHAVAVPIALLTVGTAAESAPARPRT